MKFDKSKFTNWLFLFVSLFTYLFTIFFRVFFRKPERKIIILYGFKFNGNLWAFYQYKLRNVNKICTYYLSMDKCYVDNLKGSGFPALWTGSFRDMIKVGSSSAIITDHHPQLNAIFLLFSNIKFIDVWHGIPYKGYKPSEFDYLKRYNEIWTNSKSMAQDYINKYSFSPQKILVTGYGRTDPLINSTLSKSEIVSKYQVEGYEKYVLLAPTWKQDEKNRNILPFGMTKEELFKELSKLGRKHRALFIFRTHLNVKKKFAFAEKNIAFMPYSLYPIAEEFLIFADILVSDWSSIVFDYLALQRPTIFLDVPAPFKTGFTVSPEYRFGPKVKSKEMLITVLDNYLVEPEKYQQEYGSLIQKTIDFVYDGKLDGKSLDRYYENLKGLIKL